MFSKLRRLVLVPAGAICVSAGPAAAHHVMGGKLPGSFVEGLLSGLGHPIIGLDHLAAVVAVGCLAALHRAGALLALGYVLAMMLGVAVHLEGATVPAAEALVALSVVALGAALVRRAGMPASLALALFAVTGALHGYALGESIVGAEPAPLLAYLTGLAVVQAAMALGVMLVGRLALDRAPGELAAARLLGAGVAGVGLAQFVAQIVPGA
ncbi:MAG: HupE/UreJ family protein [Variibacter sp.]|nr:HupE/UreJ family protein [Variibacter sp.]